MTLQPDFDSALIPPARPSLEVGKAITVSGMQPIDFDDAVKLLKGDPRLAFERWEEAILSDYLRDPSARPDIVAIVAKSAGGELLGVLLGSIGFRAHLAHLIVTPASRGLGVGKELLDGFIERATRNGSQHKVILTLTAENNRPDAALGFYERFGLKQQPGEVSLEMTVGEN